MKTGELINQVKHNCNISDANYWGYFSMCNLLLRLRELYYHEHSLDISTKVKKEDIADWISTRESLWEELEDQKLKTLTIQNREIDPFELDFINGYLEDENMLYGAGYGLLKKPVFFLGEIKKKFSLDKKNIWIVHKEICRDLSPPFAMSQGQNIYIRVDVLRGYLYNKYLELKTRSEKDVMRLAFERFGCAYDSGRSGIMEELSSISDEISKILVWHEIGEIDERDQFHVWMDIVAASDDRLTEFRLRGIKDVLSDTSPSGTLPSIIENQDRGLLYFYTALLDETRKALFPEITDAVREFTEREDWGIIENSVKAGRDKAKLLMSDILSLWNQTSDIKDVRKYLMESPLTACRLQK